MNLRALFSPSAWTRWRSLQPDERRLLLRSLGLLLRAHRELPSTDFQPDPSAAPPAPADAGLAREQLQRARNVARLVAYAGAACPLNVAGLHRSVVLWRLLSEESIPCRLRIGVRRGEDEAFAAHAWVECQGEPLHEAADVHEQFGPYGAAVVPVAKARPVHALPRTKGPAPLPGPSARRWLRSAVKATRWHGP